MGALGLLVLSLLFNVISQLLQPSPTSCTPPNCSLPPPKRGPLTATNHYTSSQYGFSLAYSTNNIKPSQTTASSIAWDGQLSDGSEISWSFSGSNASGQSAQQLVTKAQSQQYSDAQLAYTVPGASLGYHTGYGSVYDVTVSPANGESQHDRLLVFTAVRGGVAVTMIGLGPYQQSSSSSGSQPNPADTPLVELGDFEENLNSVTWRGEQAF
jgi:hypothetical protein